MGGDKDYGGVVNEEHRMLVLALGKMPTEPLSKLVDRIWSSDGKDGSDLSQFGIVNQDE